MRLIASLLAPKVLDLSLWLYKKAGCYVVVREEHHER